MSRCTRQSHGRTKNDTPLQRVAMGTVRILLLLLLFASTNATGVRAQDQTWEVRLTPWVGAFWSLSSGGDLPPVHEAGVVEAKMISSPALGVDVELALPVQSLSARGGVGLAVLSAVEFINWDGELSRGNSGISFGNPQGTGSSVLLLTGSAVIKPWGSDRLPYFVGGVGIKRYAYSNMAGELKEALPNDRTRTSIQVGLGLVVGHRIRLEVSDHISRQNFSFEVPHLERRSGPERTHNDLVITLGYRFDP